MKMLKYLLLTCSVVLGFGSSCSSLDKAKQSVCFDGWTTDNSGSSVVWDVPSDTLEELQSKLPVSRQIVCVHRMPSGKLDVVNIDNDNTEYGTKFNFIEGEFIVGDEDFIISY